MRTLLAIVLMPILAYFSAVAGELPMVDAKELESEDGIRQIVRRIHPTMKPAFYFFDGEQTFGIFVDPNEPTKVLLLVVPDGSILGGEYRENGKIKTLRRKENKVWVVFQDQKPEDPTGVFYEPYVGHVGTFIIVPKDGNLHLEIRLLHNLGTWTLTASRSRNGKWTGTMQKIDPFTQGKDHENARDETSPSCNPHSAPHKQKDGLPHAEPGSAPK